MDSNKENKKHKEHTIKVDETLIITDFGSYNIENMYRAIMRSHSLSFVSPTALSEALSEPFMSEVTQLFNEWLEVGQIYQKYNISKTEDLLAANDFFLIVFLMSVIKSCELKNRDILKKS